MLRENWPLIRRLYISLSMCAVAVAVATTVFVFVLVFVLVFICICILYLYCFLPLCLYIVYCTVQSQHLYPDVALLARLHILHGKLIPGWSAARIFCFCYHCIFCKDAHSVTGAHNSSHKTIIIVSIVIIAWGDHHNFLHVRESGMQEELTSLNLFSISAKIAQLWFTEITLYHWEAV